MPVTIGVDSSTSATKVEVRDADDGSLLAAGAAEHPIARPPRSEQDPAAWSAALAAALDAARSPGSGWSGWGDLGSVIAVAGQQHGLVALDSRRHLLRPAKLWNDTESAPDARALVDALGGGSAWAAACGSVPVAAFTITKLAWLRRVEPVAFARLAHVVLPHDYLTSVLSGELVTDAGDASGTGYFSPAERRWRADLLALVDSAVDWSARLPRVLEPAAPAGELLGEVRRSLHLSGRFTVAPGTGDNMAAALGVGLVPGDVVVSLGTSGTVFSVADAPVSDGSGVVAGFADATGRYLPLVCTLNATRVPDAFARLLGVDRAVFGALALSSPPGSNRVVLRPYLEGERTPDRPDATGVLSGLRTTTTQADVARAAFEGVLCGLLDGLDALRGLGVAVDGRLVLVGGGARSAAFRQVLADLSGRAVEVLGEEELVARGACVQAAAVLHGRDVLEVAKAWRPAATEVTDPIATPEQASAARAAYAASVS